jgi:ribokinase
MQALTASHKTAQPLLNMQTHLNSVAACHVTRTSKAAPAAAAAAAAADKASNTHVKPLVVVGSINADLVLSVDRLPAPGETLGAKGMSFFPGGKVAVAAAHNAC